MFEINPNPKIDRLVDLFENPELLSDDVTRGPLTLNFFASVVPR